MGHGLGHARSLFSSQTEPCAVSAFGIEHRWQRANMRAIRPTLQHTAQSMHDVIWTFSLSAKLSARMHTLNALMTARPLLTMIQNCSAPVYRRVAEQPEQLLSMAALFGDGLGHRLQQGCRDVLPPQAECCQVAPSQRRSAPSIWREADTAIPNLLSFVACCVALGCQLLCFIS